MNKPFYGWYVCLGCALLLFCTSGLAINTFTIYQPFIMKQNHFTNTQSSGIILVRNLFSFFSMLLTGFYYKKFSLKHGLLIAGLGMIFSYVLFGLANSLPVYFIAAAMTGLGYGFGTMLPISMILERWFIQKRTLAISLCNAVTGLSTLGIPSILTFLIQRKGLRFTFLTEAVFMTILIALSSLFICSHPSEKNMEPLKEGTPSFASSSDIPVQKVFLKKKDWILIWALLLFLGAVTNTGYSHLSVLLNHLGFQPELIAIAITFSGLSLTGSKCLYGWMSERVLVTRRIILFGSILIIGIILLCLCAGHTAVMLSGIILYSTGLALTTVGMSEWAGDFSSSETYDVTIRNFNIGYSGGSLLFAPLPGILADSFHGSYFPSYLFFLFCSLFVILSVLYFYKRGN